MPEELTERIEEILQSIMGKYHISHRDSEECLILAFSDDRAFELIDECSSSYCQPAGSPR